jgi:hypothetical protein
MAQKIVTIYTDDLTGEESSEASTHTFALDGVQYEIDLGPDSYDKFLEALGPFMKSGRKQGRGRAQRAGGRQRQAAGPDSAAIRAWVKENGYEVSDRGRVPTEVREAYEKAHWPERHSSTGCRPPSLWEEALVMFEERYI